ncbi:MAG: DUF433 domain-containing protein [Acidobacteriota bacterium]|nr:DUF433 domain-containing protein [Acidobacteriota bacterium]
MTNLSRAEKAQLLQWIARDLGDAFPGIETTPGVIGGAACIRQTRIAVWMLEQARRLGVSEADLLRNYPGLTAQDLANAWNYVRSHQSEIKAQIAANETDDD